MRVKCILCESVETIDSYSLLAKQLRKTRKHTYMCPTCDERITTKTKARLATGSYRLHHKKNKKEHI